MLTIIRSKGSRMVRTREEIRGDDQVSKEDGRQTPESKESIAAIRIVSLCVGHERRYFLAQLLR